MRRFRTSDAAWRAVRLRVLERDGYRCQIRLPGCLGVATDGDHIVPRHLGGAWYDEGNVRAACGPCNRARGNRLRQRYGSANRRPSRNWYRDQPGANPQEER
jgi:5-methylcytosine-specific restriction endonuclease McrA